MSSDELTYGKYIGRHCHTELVRQETTSREQSRDFLTHLVAYLLASFTAASRHVTWA